ncbi:hypothetical protein LEMLEM_LOCUS4720 [Lemmus lemmus]
MNYGHLILFLDLCERYKLIRIQNVDLSCTLSTFPL